jgi:hypothetical protein
MVALHVVWLSQVSIYPVDTLARNLNIQQGSHGRHDHALEQIQGTSSAVVAVGLRSDRGSQEPTGMTSIEAARELCDL